jgi:hypothetical protein
LRQRSLTLPTCSDKEEEARRVQGTQGMQGMQGRMEWMCRGRRWVRRETCVRGGGVRRRKEGGGRGCHARRGGRGAFQQRI